MHHSASTSQQAPVGRAAIAHIDAAAQLQQAQKVAVSSAMAAAKTPLRKDGSGELMGRVSDMEQASPGRSDRKREKVARQDRKRSKPSKDKDDKRHKKKNKHERHEHRQERPGRSDKELLDNATALLSSEVLSQKVSTAEIMAVAAQLHKKSKKHREKNQKHSSSKHHKRRREHSP